MIGIILGTRPEIIKLFPLINLLEKKKTNFSIIHTGQHYSESLSNLFINQFKIPKQKLINLNVGSGTHGEQTATMMMKIDKYLSKNKNLKVLVVYGDTNSALAGSIVGSKIHKLKIIHLEAGLRSFDKDMPEEINRRLIDHCSDILFCPTEISKKYLLREGIKKEKIYCVGNTIVDTVFSRIVQKKLKNKYKSKNKINKKIVLTIHREENTQDLSNLKKIFKSVYKICEKFDLKVIFPAHPKTKKLLKHINYDSELISVVDPLNYVEFLYLIKNSKLIISDSGGIQEEACILKTPLITVRNSTERPETLKIGCNVLSKINDDRLFKDAKKILNKKIKWRNPYGDGKSSLKIYKIIKNIHKFNVERY